MVFVSGVRFPDLWYPIFVFQASICEHSHYTWKSFFYIFPTEDIQETPTNNLFCLDQDICSLRLSYLQMFKSQNLSHLFHIPQDFLENVDVSMDHLFVMSLVTDIVKVGSCRCYNFLPSLMQCFNLIAR